MNEDEKKKLRGLILDVAKGASNKVSRDRAVNTLEAYVAELAGDTAEVEEEVEIESSE